MTTKAKAAKPAIKMAKKPSLKHDPRNLLTSLVLVFPLFLVYQVGVLFTLPMLNGADFLTVFLFRNLGLSTKAYLGYTAIVAAAFAIGVLILRRRQQFDPGLVWRVFLESAIYALTMGSLIVFVMTRVFHISPRLAGGVAAQSLGTRVVMSLGAGVYEETVFRLGIMTGLGALLERGLGLRRWISAVVALAVSSALFSAMHHIPPYGDPFAIGVFTFRVLAGACFGLIFWYRGFAVAVYTHALYDLYVLVLR
ncbi:MAG TPA: CPBP family intramembrane glutamic endopeptidase [Minicystis sp.]|jgi:membrane protease YdiL (CAAX protease family)|nr:CPBP family intramembrane glutamic endopeptidase [Minicystis sp.]